MNTENYSPPVDKLLALGDPRDSREWPNYLEFGLTSEQIPDLIRMVTDKELNEAPGDSREVWAPLHAWRALGQLRAGAAIEPLMRLFHEQEDDDWAGTELPTVFGMIGPPAIPSLAAYMADESRGMFPRISAVESLENIAKMHPDARAECVAIITRQLERFAQQEPTFNAFLISSLVELGAVESASLIERAFAADSVDVSIGGDWDDVQVDLGLKEPGEKQIRQQRLLEELQRALTAPPQPLKSKSSSNVSHKVGAKAKAKAKRKQAKLSRKKNRRRR
ncbi:MAG TPA: PBS lyase [Blastocatellia bacterium]|nr:PBS lyase [Blastocatellia bacterium]